MHEIAKASNLDNRVTEATLNVVVTDRQVSNDDAQHLYPVILCGGAGKRLWPLSRQAYPKQLLPLASDRTMLQETAERVRNLAGNRAPIVLCNEEHRFLIDEQLSAIGLTPEAILCEPASRNTAPALAAAATYLRERDPEAVMLALPADHHIADLTAFESVVYRAISPARNGYFVTFGIRPAGPATGYGYVERGAPLNGGSEGVYSVKQFIEKPDMPTAALLVADGAHYWNSGMFVLPVTGFLDQLAVHGPSVATAASQAVSGARIDGRYIQLDAQSFAAAPDCSIDYALMEHTDRAVVIPTDMGWSDLGSWNALREVKSSDDHGNVLLGNVIVDEVRDSYIHADGRLVAVMGLSDLVVVDTEDALLVSHASKSGEVGRLVQQLAERQMPEPSRHPRAHRPWGSYQSVKTGPRFQVKHIVVKPGAQLSLQLHHHRSEHWVVVAGTARVTSGTQTRLLYENQSAYIPTGSVHRLENPGRIPLHLVEVQLGSYLGEDDIVRVEDTYGRV